MPAFRFTVVDAPPKNCTKNTPSTRLTVKSRSTEVDNLDEYLSVFRRCEMLCKRAGTFRSHPVTEVPKQPCHTYCARKKVAKILRIICTRDYTGRVRPNPCPRQLDRWSACLLMVDRTRGFETHRVHTRTILFLAYKGISGKRLIVS